MIKNCNVTVKEFLNNMLQDLKESNVNKPFYNFSFANGDVKLSISLIRSNDIIKSDQSEEDLGKTLNFWFADMFDLLSDLLKKEEDPHYFFAIDGAKFLVKLMEVKGEYLRETIELI